MQALSSVEPERSIAGSVRFLWAWMSPRRRRHFAAALGVMLVGAAAELMTIGAVLPFLALVSNPEGAARLPGFRQIIELLGSFAPDNLILLAAVLLAVTAIFAAAVRIALNWVSLRFVLAFSHEMGAAVFGRMMRQPYSYYVTRNTSELLAGFDKIHIVTFALLMPAMQGVIAAAMALAIVVLLFVIDPLSATVAALAMALSYFGLSLAVRRRLRRNSELLSRTATARIQTIQEGLGGIRDVLLEQSQEVFEAKFRRLDHAYRRAQTVNNFINTSPRFIVEATGIVLIAALVVYLGDRPGGVIAAIPVLGALALGAQRLLPLLQLIYGGWSATVGNRRVLFDVVGLMRAPVVGSAPRNRGEPVATFQTDLRLEGVGFRYQDRHPAVESIDLVIPKGARLGVVGETGSGKSTLLDLVMGLLEPTSGMIRIDGVPLTDANRANWQAQIAHVPQAIYLADSSIASNIAFGEPEDLIDSEQVRAAAELAHVDAFIRDLPEGYATLVGERGVRLSGGQRQRIGIARALYKRTPVLVFDEATSALDDATEQAIMASILAVGGDVTLLMIAHRTSTLAGCDRIIKLAGGHVVETGSYEELFETGPKAKRS